MLQHVPQNQANHSERASSSSKDAHCEKTQEMYACKNMEKSDHFHIAGKNDNKHGHLRKYNGGSSKNWKYTVSNILTRYASERNEVVI